MSVATGTKGGASTYVLGIGDRRVRSLHYDNAALGLDLLGCDWHPSARDHQALSGALTAAINDLPLRW